MVRHTYVPLFVEGTIAELNASTVKWPRGAIIMPTDSDEIRIGTGKKLFSVLSVMKKSDKITLLAGSVVVADISAKVDLIITKMIASGLMKAA